MTPRNENEKNKTYQLELNVIIDCCNAHFESFKKKKLTL